ncbi:MULTISPECIES: DUF3822 family protein [unclassified Myroides]|uniref:DUF3822 family protein n=1 Tax=unclassified Myroides TaxID=2642485 RepID=UPI003D2F65F5
MKQSLNKLIIQVSLQKFTFIIQEIESKRIHHFVSEGLNQNKTIEDQLHALFAKHEILNTPFEDVLVLHDSNLNTFVPTALFDEQAMGSYLQYNTKVFSSDFFAFDELTGKDINNVYIPYVQINNVLFEKLGSFTYQNINTALVERILTLSTDESEIEVYAYVQKDHFELVVTQKGELLLFNSFLYTTAQDFIYYLLFVYEQLKLDPEHIRLKLISRIEKEDPLFEQAYTYIRHVDILEEQAAIAPSLLLHYQVPKQHYILFHL